MDFPSETLVSNLRNYADEDHTTTDGIMSLLQDTFRIEHNIPLHRNGTASNGLNCIRPIDILHGFITFRWSYNLRECSFD